MENTMLSQILSRLPGHPWYDRIQYFDTIDSTNTYAKKLAMEGAAAGTVIIAGRQTAGRGRLGRSFSSPENMGIYLSVILRPNCKPTDIMHLTCATGVAALEAIARPDVGIKWTNDLVMGKRKLGGILTELSVDPATGNVAWVVVGIGINCCQKSWDFPEEIRHMACSLGMEDRSDVMNLMVDLIEALHRMDRDLLSKKADIMSSFREKCVTIGSQISVVRGDDIRHGTAVAVDDEGGLLVQYPGGGSEIVTSGEVSIRGMYGYL
jgi:BirA family biotin operon repressor/biotin-[acetyl-CoA-carboxylase] ligase